MKTKFTTIILLLLTLTFIFSSCASSKTVMQYENAELSEHIYAYWLKQYKTYFLSSASDMTDTDEFWNKKLNEDSDMTMEQYFTELADINIKKNLVCVKLFDEYGLTIPDETYDRIESEIQDMITEYGGLNALNKALGESGINDKMYREIYIIQEKIAILFNHLYGAESGKLLTDDEIDAYFTSSYVRAKYITINLYDTNESGGLVEVNAEEKERRAAQAEAIYKDIAENDADFETLFKLYTYDRLEGYEHGIYFSNKKTGAHSVIDKAISLQVGDVAIVRDEYVAYVVKRLELEDKAYLNEKIDQVQFTDLYTLCAEDLFQSMLYEDIDEIVITESVKKNHSIRD
jgi:PPIC-type PPIASE domain.